MHFLAGEAGFEGVDIDLGEVKAYGIDRARALEALNRNPDDTQAVESLSRLSAQAAAADLRPVW